MWGKDFKALDTFAGKKIKILTIENPYDTYEHSEEVRHYMSLIWKMKLEGYKSHHNYGILPIGEADWISNHTVFCEVQEDGSLLPFCGYKSVTVQHCSHMKKNFPILEHMFKGQLEECSEYVESINEWINERVSLGKIVGYNSGWTMSKYAQSDKVLKQIAINLTLTMYYHYYTHYKVPNIITSASSTFKVDRIQKTMGFDYLKHNGKELSDYNSKEFIGAPFYIMHLSDGKFPEYFARESEKHRKLWEDRIVINAESVLGEEKKAV